MRVDRLAEQGAEAAPVDLLVNRGCGVRRHGDDGGHRVTGLRIARPSPIDEVKSRLVGQAEVGQDEVGAQALERGEGLTGRSDGGHIRARQRQHDRQHLTRIVIILDDQYGPSGEDGIKAKRLVCQTRLLQRGVGSGFRSNDTPGSASSRPTIGGPENQGDQGTVWIQGGPNEIPDVCHSPDLPVAVSETSWLTRQRTRRTIADMVSLRIALLALATVLAFHTTASAERIYPTAGGTRVEPDPQHKKLNRIVAESPTVRVIVSSPPGVGFKFNHPVFALHVRVENLSAEPLRIDPTAYYLVDEAGQGYAGLEPQDAIRRSMDAMSGTMRVLAGRDAEAAERKASADIKERSLQPGLVPPGSWKEGLVFFETPKKPAATKTAVKMTLTGLWAEPFVLTIER